MYWDGGFWSFENSFWHPLWIHWGFFLPWRAFSFFSPTMISLLYTTFLGRFLHGSGVRSHAFMKPLELHY
jgi:hypothetical protein